MVAIEWATPAFHQLEALPAELMFAIIEKVDVPASFPEMGAPLISKSRVLAGCRQLIVSRDYRVVYQTGGEGTKQTLYILAVQHCRQHLPSARELKRRRATDPESRASD